MRTLTTGLHLGEMAGQSHVTLIKGIGWGLALGLALAY